MNEYKFNLKQTIKNAGWYSFVLLKRILRHEMWLTIPLIMTLLLIFLTNPPTQSDKILLLVIGIIIMGIDFAIAHECYSDNYAFYNLFVTLPKFLFRKSIEFIKEKIVVFDEIKQLDEHREPVLSISEIDYSEFDGRELKGWRGEA